MVGGTAIFRVTEALAAGTVPVEFSKSSTFNLKVTSQVPFLTRASQPRAEIPSRKSSLNV